MNARTTYDQILFDGGTYHGSPSDLYWKSTSDTLPLFTYVKLIGTGDKICSTNPALAHFAHVNFHT